ncbi:MAG: DUF948 domain-containing protein [Peptoniphilaceae bacterium]|nr:DUF948 domain-containing protein [Peptoniphilaceae bacterium]MDY6018019.1 DUF948 domain-containing protein [Anaerococcus sp.]
MVTINLKLIADVILFIVAVIAIVFLIQVLVKVSKLLDTVNGIVNKNSSHIDKTIEKLPDLVDTANNLVVNVNDIVNDPNLKMAISKANDTITNVSMISEDVKDTVNYFGETAIDGADSFGEGIASVSDYATMIRDVVDIVRDVIAGR